MFCSVTLSLYGFDRKAQTGPQWLPSVWPACWRWLSFLLVKSTSWHQLSPSTSCSPTASLITPTSVWPWPSCFRQNGRRRPWFQEGAAGAGRPGRVPNHCLNPLAPTTGAEARVRGVKVLCWSSPGIWTGSFHLPQNLTLCLRRLHQGKNWAAGVRAERPPQSGSWWTALVWTPTAT